MQITRGGALRGKAAGRMKVCAGTPAQVGFPIPGNIPGEAGWGSEQPGVAEDVSAHGRAGWIRHL